MSQFSQPIKNLVKYFSRLPGVGPKTALRFVFFLLKQKEEENVDFGKAIESLKKTITSCKICCNFSTQDPCPLCSNKNRNPEIICIVAEHQDLPPIESTKEYNGLYHVLGGVLDPLHGITPDKLKVRELVDRIKNKDVKIKEVVLALNPNIEGETTMLYLTKLIKSFDKNGLIKITRLARGLPMGGDIEYADEVTLSNALKGRKEL